MTARKRRKRKETGGTDVVIEILVRQTLRRMREVKVGEEIARSLISPYPGSHVCISRVVKPSKRGEEETP